VVNQVGGYFAGSSKGNNSVLSINGGSRNHCQVSDSLELGIAMGCRHQHDAGSPFLH